MSKRTDEIKEAATTKPEKKRNKRTDFLSTGSTLLNLACSGRPSGGFLKGKYYFLVGDSSSGKTFLSMTCFAEAAHSEYFKHHRLIYDNVEDGCLMDLEKYFGKKTADKVEPPAIGFDGLPQYSRQIEDFYFHVHDAIEEEKPFIYVLDSMDALTSQDEIEKFDETKKAMRAGKTTSGSFGDGKAKKNSSSLRRLLTPLSKMDSILIIINQTRDNLGFGFAKKTRSGGHALKFYAACEIWTSVKGGIKKTVKGKDRKIGNYIQIETRKNRITGKETSVVVPIYPSHGIDDIQSCIEYLIDEGHWKKKGANIGATEFDSKGNMNHLIEKIESEGKEKELQKLVWDVWKEIEETSAVKRKRRYG